ncbi:branched-chain amino acid aminotransferase [Streptococcus criceti]|uniref:DUF2969 domain-containing protein n=1 Tax=Streptococcus criceti HS-6 TaxID=873449 RepID=G5JQS7_STRCG|nr:DUF2969 domain-containing protein [Streptococcus criceti]EHI75098.1 hypothetical protein STRCR_1885 [Streptococcus criceti HS-6]SUN43020.1 branched-chain amino acid aminotransferase [Streptococcus criceti]
MAKKDKKIEIQLADAQVLVSGKWLAGYELTIGKRTVGQIVEVDGQFTTVEKEGLKDSYKTLDQAIESIIESYNLNH